MGQATNRALTNQGITNHLLSELILQISHLVWYNVL